ncbi:MAG: sugar ABC transporter permease [Lachnospiraceae bacterium]|nr:sugar ABC transporter permease [Lachnospiraceae bacterium]
MKGHKTVAAGKGKPLLTRMYKYRYMYAMYLPVFIVFVIFSYIPMVGILISFTKYTPFTKTPEWVGFENFKTLFASDIFWRAVKNTILISSVNIILSITTCVGLALLIDEVKSVWFRKVVQSILYIPHFISWVVVASIFTVLLSPQDGFINGILEYFGKDPVYFLADNAWWRPCLWVIDRWKGIGWGTIIYIAALTAVDPEMHEAATIDGANRIQRIRHITLPTIAPTILVVFIMDLAKILNIFESVWVLQNSAVLGASDVIGTYVYRIGITNAQYGLSAAAGLFKSVISVTLVTIANRASRKIRGEGILS